MYCLLFVHLFICIGFLFSYSRTMDSVRLHVVVFLVSFLVRTYTVWYEVTMIPSMVDDVFSDIKKASELAQWVKKKDTSSKSNARSWYARKEEQEQEEEEEEDQLSGNRYNADLLEALDSMPGELIKINILLSIVHNIANYVLSDRETKVRTIFKLVIVSAANTVYTEVGSQYVRKFITKSLCLDISIARVFLLGTSDKDNAMCPSSSIVLHPHYRHFRTRVPMYGGLDYTVLHDSFRLEV